MSNERSNDIAQLFIDGVLQGFIGPRETRQDPGVPKDARVFRDLSDMTEIDLGMSNCFGEIDQGMDEALREQPAQVYGRHAGWNFNGLVWFENGLFHEQVWCYRAPREEISSPTLRELMDAVNAEYGSD